MAKKSKKVIEPKVEAVEEEAPEAVEEEAPVEAPKTAGVLAKRKGEKEATLALSKEDLSSIIKDAVSAATEGAIKALKGPEKSDVSTSALMEKAMEGMTDEQKAEFRASFGGGKCSGCGQIAVKGRYPCKGKHTQMVVFPSDHDWGKWFQGCILGGVKYLSDGPGHMITVPAANDFQSWINEWVQMEKTNAHGKKRSHNSGSINGQTGNTQGFNPFNGPGFR